MYAARRDRAPRRHPPAPVAGCPALLPGAAHGRSPAAPRRARVAARARGRRAGAVRSRATTTRPRARPSDPAQRIVVAPVVAARASSGCPEAESLLDDYHRGVLELGAPVRAVGRASCWPTPRASACAHCSTRAPSVSPCPRARSSGPAGIERLGPALEALGDRPLFIHPGPAAGSPAWFPALTAYVAEMSTAWHAWAQWGRPAHPRLKVIFAMLAGPGAAARRAARRARRPR